MRVLCARCGLIEMPDHPFQRVEPSRMFIQARDQREFLPAGLTKHFTAAHANFLKRLQAIRNKGRANDRQAFHAGPGQAANFVIGVGLHPRVATKP